MTRRRILVGVLLVAIVGAAAWAGATLLENQRRDEAVAALLSRVAAAADGEVLDLREAFDEPWERAIVVAPYTPGDVANDELGFDHFDEVITQGDGVTLLVFVLGDAVVADIALYGQAF